MLLLLLLNLFFGAKGGIQERQLQHSLLKDYRRDVLPLWNNSKMNVSVGMAMRAINNVDQLDGTIRFNVWFRYRWRDEYLTWNPKITDQLTFTTDPTISSSIWTPDIYIYNTANNPMSQLAYTHATVYPTGDVLLSRPGIITSTCSFDLSDFPYDQQVCALKFGSWAYSSKRLDLYKFIPDVDVSNYQYNHEWTLVHFNSTINEKYYSCCEDAYQDITFNIIIRRKPGYFSQNIILPAFTTSSLMVLALFIPWNSGERISFATTVMLTMTVYLLILSEHLPQTNTNPLMSIMFIGLTMLAFIGLFFTIVITSFHSNEQTICTKCITDRCRRRKIMDIPDEQRENTNENIDENIDENKNDIHQLTTNIEHYFTYIFISTFVIFSSIIYSRIPVYN